MIAVMSDVIIAGLDEAGRGSLAGPVVAGACVLQMESIKWKEENDSRGSIPVINDSKLLTSQERDTAFTWIMKNCFWGVGIVDAEDIDREGILACTEKAMQLALKELQLSVLPTYLLIDGRDKFWFDLPHSSIIKGDQKEECIAAASIVAKVTRDRLMIEYGQEFPTYGFGQHKGYGSDYHCKMIKQWGHCPLHRRTFLRNLVHTPLGAFSG